MAINAEVRCWLTLTGLTGSDIDVPIKFNTTTPTAYNVDRGIISVADTAQALDLGSVVVEELIILYAVDGDLEVDCDFDSAFDADLTIESGTCAVFKPAGTVYVKNATALETPEYVAYIVGTRS